MYLSKRAATSLAGKSISIDFTNLEIIVSSLSANEGCVESD